MHPHPYGFDGALVLPRDPIPCEPCTMYRVNAGRIDKDGTRLTQFSFHFDKVTDAIREHRANRGVFAWSEVEVWEDVTDIRNFATGRRVALITEAVLT